jgi:WD40 repeat protein
VTPELGRIEVPGADESEERAARVVAAAFAGTLPRHRRRRASRPIAAVALAVVLVAAVASPPGRAFVDHVRRAVGVDHARPALFTLPAPGRILVSAGSGTWVTSADGERRLLGNYDDASWSPFGRYIVATRPNELVTLDTEGTVRWTLARPAVTFPRWTGSATDTRIAYLSGDRLHVVAGDGTSDFVAGDAPAADIPPAWSSNLGFILAYAGTDRRVHTLITAKGGSLWSATTPGPPQSLEWSSDGRQLLVLSPGRISILDGGSGHLLGGEAAPDVVAVAYRPGSSSYAELHGSAAGSRITLGERTLFSFGGVLRGLTWSPDGRWLLVGSPASDQWVFIRADGRKIVAVSNISAQFHSAAFPEVEGWCCGT